MSKGSSGENCYSKNNPFWRRIFYTRGPLSIRNTREIVKSYQEAYPCAHCGGMCNVIGEVQLCQGCQQCFCVVEKFFVSGSGVGKLSMGLYQIQVNLFTKEIRDLLTLLPEQERRLLARILLVQMPVEPVSELVRLYQERPLLYHVLLKTMVKHQPNLMEDFNKLYHHS